MGITNRTTSSIDRVHQFTSPDGLGMTTMEPRTAYRRSGENLEFLNDCLATQIEAIIQELDFIRVHPPQYIHQKKPQNETIIEKLETRECSDPRPLIPLRNKKELQKGGRNTPKFLGPIKNRKGSKNETIYGELEKRCRSHPRYQKELQNQTSWELGKSGHNNPRLLDLIRNKKRSKNEISKKELEEGGCDYNEFWTSKRHQEELQNTISLELERRGCSYQRLWILKRNKEELQNQTSLELEGRGCSDQSFWIIKGHQRELQNQINLELERGVCSYQRFWILKRTQEELQNQTSWELEGGGHDYHEFWIPKRNQVEFQNKTSWELEGRGYAYNEFWIPKRPQKKPQNTNSLGLQKGGLNNHRFLDFIKNTKKSRNETVDRELEGKAWRDLGANVLYNIYCTVQYTDGSQ